MFDVSDTRSRVPTDNSFYLWEHNSAFFYELTLTGAELCLFFACYGKFLRTLLAYCADRPPVVTAAVVPIYGVRIEDHVVSVVAVAVVRVERTRPVVAVTARTVEIAVVAIARSRKKYGVTILYACYFISVYSVLSGPCPSAV